MILIASVGQWPKVNVIWEFYNQGSSVFRENTFKLFKYMSILSHTFVYISLSPRKSLILLTGINIFMPRIRIWGHLDFVLFVCVSVFFLSVCGSVFLWQKTFNFGHKFWTTWDRDFIFGIAPYSTNETLSNDIEVNNCVTLTVTCILEIANLDFVATWAFRFCKHILYSMYSFLYYSTLYNITVTRHPWHQRLALGSGDHIHWHHGWHLPVRVYILYITVTRHPWHQWLALGSGHHLYRHHGGHLPVRVQRQYPEDGADGDESWGFRALPARLRVCSPPQCWVTRSSFLPCHEWSQGWRFVILSTMLKMLKADYETS